MVNNAIISIAFLLSFLKLGEIALRPHQRKYIQERLEHLTLLLDTAYPNYAFWIEKLPNIGGAIVFLFGISILVISCLILEFSASTILTYAGMLGLYASILIVGASAYWHYAPRVLVDWKLGPKSIRIGAFPTAIWAIVAACSVALIAKILGIFFTLPLLGLGYRRYLAPMSALPGIALTAGLAYPALWVAKPLIKLLIAILWRVIEYPAGAWMACLFLISATLAIINLSLTYLLS